MSEAIEAGCATREQAVRWPWPKIPAPQWERLLEANLAVIRAERGADGRAAEGSTCVT
jgi:hypothetical protein